MLPSFDAIAPRVLYACAGFAVGSLLTLLTISRQPEPAPSVVTLAQPARVLTRVERVTLPCAPVQVYAPPAKAKIKLPASVQANPASHVLTSTDLPASERDTRVSTVLDSDTGAVDTYPELLPLPLLRPESRTTLGLSYGLKSGSPQPVGRLTAQQDLLQIKAAHLGVNGTLDSDGEGFAGIGLMVRW